MKKIAGVFLFACVFVASTAMAQSKKKLELQADRTTGYSDLGLLMLEQCQEKNSVRACDYRLVVNTNDTVWYAAFFGKGTKYSMIDEPAGDKIKNMTRIKIESGEYSGKEVYILSSHLN